MPFESTGTESQVYCSQCGKAFPPAEVVMLGNAAVCAVCKPVYLRRLQEGGLPAARRYKGFWIRFVELIVDGLVLSAVFWPISFTFLMPYFRAAVSGTPPAALLATFGAELALIEGIGLLINIVYNTLMLGRFGATLGDMVIGAKVVTPDGQPITYARALGRTLMKIVSGLILCIGYLLAAFDSQKRTLHDRVAGTVVIAK